MALTWWGESQQNLPNVSLLHQAYSLMLAIRDTCQRQNCPPLCPNYTINLSSDPKKLTLTRNHAGAEQSSSRKHQSGHRRHHHHSSPPHQTPPPHPSSPTRSSSLEWPNYTPLTTPASSTMSPAPPPKPSNYNISLRKNLPRMPQPLIDHGRYQHRYWMTQ